MGTFFDKEKIKQTLTVEDITKILIDLGSKEPIYQNKNEIYFTTVCHGGEKHKLCYYVQSKMFHCYTDCGDSMDIYELVIRSRRTQGVNLTFAQAVKYVASVTNNMFYSNLEDTQVYRINDWEWINRIKMIKSQKVIPQLSEISEHILEIFCPYPIQVWLDEGISRESMAKYQISYWGQENKIIIPHRDINGRLIGIRGRSFNQWELDEGKKYMPIVIEGQTLKHTLGNNLYGLCQNEEAIRRIGKIIIFEAEKSVLLCDTYYHQNNFSVAVCGSAITPTQCRILQELGVREVMIAFDKEYEDASSKVAEVYGNKLLKLAAKLIPYFTVYILWDSEGLLEKKDSPADKGQDVLEKLMKSKIEIHSTEREEKI